MAAAYMIWYARHAAATIGATIASVVAGTALYGQVTGGPVLTMRIENMEITGGDMPVEVINTFGITQLLNEKRPELRKIAFDLVFSDTSKSALTYLYGSALLTPPSGFLRYQGGEKATTATHRTRCAVGVNFTDGTNVVNALLNNALMTGYGGPNQASDDYGKVRIEFACVAGDYYEEDNLADS